MKFKNIELAAGMVIRTNDNKSYVVFPVQMGGTKFGFISTEGNWTTTLYDSSIIEIRRPPVNGLISSGEILWERSKELTMREIAEKFGIPVEELRIKKE